MEKNEKAIVPTVTIGVFLVFTIVATVGFQIWYQDYFSDLTADVETSSTVALEPSHITRGQLHLQGVIEGNVEVQGVIVDGETCEVDEILDEEKQEIGIAQCITHKSSGNVEVSVVTENHGTISRTISLRDDPAEDTYQVEFFEDRTQCPQEYQKIYALADKEDTHVEIPSQNNYEYIACINHWSDMDISTQCGNNSHTLFYLGDETNSHAWLDNSTAYDEFDDYNWQEVCIDTPTDTSIKVSEEKPHENSECLGSLIEEDNVFGAHMGDCNAHELKIWITE